MIHRLTLHRDPPPYAVLGLRPDEPMIHRPALRRGYAVLGLRPWCFTCDNPECGDRYPAGLVVSTVEAGPTRARAIWRARCKGWHVSRHGVACPGCMRAWDALMMSASHRDLSLDPRQTPDPSWSTLYPYQLIRRTPRQTT